MFFHSTKIMPLKGIIRWFEIFCLWIASKVLGKTSKIFSVLIFQTQVIPLWNLGKWDFWGTFRAFFSIVFKQKLKISKQHILSYKSKYTEKFGGFASRSYLQAKYFRPSDYPFKVCSKFNWANFWSKILKIIKIKNEEEQS